MKNEDVHGKQILEREMGEVDILGFSTEKVRLHKLGGEDIPEIEAVVDMEQFTIDDGTLLIEEGDIFERTLPNGGIEYYRVVDRGFYKGGFGIPDHYQAKVMKVDKHELEQLIQKSGKQKLHKVFISHSSKDVQYMQLFVELLEDIGLPDGSIICTSVSGHGIPGGEKIYDWLRRQFVECDLRVIFALSDNYYSSPASLNEMGAAWITKATDTLLLLPGFDFMDIQGCVDSGKIGIKLDAEEREIKYRLDELKDTLIAEYSLPPITSARWERHRDDFIKKIGEIVPQENNKKNKASEIQLSKKAAVLLVYATRSTDGQIMKIQYLSGTSLCTGKWDFIGENQNPRNVAEWEDALYELQGYHLIEAVGYKGEIFKVSAGGYKVADQVIETLNIDVEKEPDLYWSEGEG